MSSSTHHNDDQDCPFCTITTTYPPTPPSAAPGHPSLDPSKLEPPAYVLLSTEHVIAFLDFYPLTRGHVLCCPRRHVEKVGGLTADEGREIGAILPLLSRALIRALTPDIAPEAADYNIVQNNGPGAAQVVPHTHFHFIPRYPFEYQVVEPHPILLLGGTDGHLDSSGSGSYSEQRSYQQIPRPKGMEATKILFGRGQRHYRDEEDSERLIDVMRRCVRAEWEREFGLGNEEGVNGSTSTTADGGGGGGDEDNNINNDGTTPTTTTTTTDNGDNNSDAAAVVERGRGRL